MSDRLHPATPKELSTKLLFSSDVRKWAANDYGGLNSRLPRGVLRPSTVDDIASLVRYARTGGLGVSARGRAHCTGGQAQADDGFVVDMSSLATVRECAKGKIDVEAGADWDKVTGHMPPGWSLRVIPSFQGLSVGGTLSVGGIGESTFLNGLVTDSVEELEVVTGRGEIVTCSAHQNDDLFSSCLAGLGQFGLIVRAILTLRQEEESLKRSYLIYGAIEELVLELEQFVFSDSIAGLVGFVIPHHANWIPENLLGSGPAWIAKGGHQYSLVLKVTCKTEIEPINPPLGLLENIPSIEEISADTSMLHPWLYLIVPSDKANLMLDVMLSKTALPGAGGGMTLLYPVVPERIRARFFSVPRCRTAILIVLLRSVRPANRQQIPALIQENHRLYEQCKMLGGCCYPAGSLYLASSDWSDHFGMNWQKFLQVKQKYDPDAILARGQGIV